MAAFSRREREVRRTTTAQSSTATTSTTVTVTMTDTTTTTTSSSRATTTTATSTVMSTAAGADSIGGARSGMKSAVDESSSQKLTTVAGTQCFLHLNLDHTVHLTSRRVHWATR